MPYEVGKLHPNDVIPMRSVLGRGLREITLDPIDIVSVLLDDAPGEAIAFALASAVFEVRPESNRLLLCLDEADDIRARLYALGFDIVPRVTDNSTVT